MAVRLTVTDLRNSFSVVAEFQRDLENALNDEFSTGTAENLARMLEAACVTHARIAISVAAPADAVPTGEGER